MAAREAAGAVVKITGRADWRVWLANDRDLSPPLQIIDAAPDRFCKEDNAVPVTKRLVIWRPDPVDDADREQALKDALAECDAASRKLRRLTADRS